MDDAKFRAAIERAHEYSEKIASTSKLVKVLAESQRMKEIGVSLYEGLRTGESKPTIFYLHLSWIVYKDEFARDVINWIVSEHILADDPIPLPEHLKRVWFRIRSEQLPPPKKKRGRPVINYDRDCLILTLLHDVKKQYGLKVIDAIGIVAEEFVISEERINQIRDLSHDNKSPLCRFYKVLKSERKKTPKIHRELPT